MPRNGQAWATQPMHKKNFHKLDMLKDFGSMSEKMCTALKIAGACRMNIVISGGTGSGKTTMLNALSKMIDPGERVLTIEDAAELRLQQPHWLPLETRPPNLEGQGAITIGDLVKNALRMRPDRIILGEIRGAEAFDAGVATKGCGYCVTKEEDDTTFCTITVKLTGLPTSAVNFSLLLRPGVDASGC